MDIFTIGFFSIVILYMVFKYLFGFYMFRKSIYKVLYSGFTEYRMRRKSIEGMSESYVLKELFNTNRIIYHVLENKNSKPSAFITIFLTSGCYIVEVLKGDINEEPFIRAEEFKQSYIINQLKESVYKALNYPTTVITVLPDSNDEVRKYDGQKDKLFVRRKELLQKINEIHKKSVNLLTAIEVQGIFMTLAHDSIENEKIVISLE